MVYLCLDTCVWIYLANGTEPVKILRLIDQEVRKGNIKLLVPDIIVEEFKRNKESSIDKGIRKVINEIEERYKILSSLLGEGSPQFMDFVLEQKVEHEAFKQYQNSFLEIKRIVNEATERNIALIESLFNAPMVVQLPKDNVVQEVVNRGLQKKAPFATADTTIVLSFLNFVEMNGVYNAKFVSSNTRDFCEKVIPQGKEKYTLHSDLKPLFEKSNVEFFYKVSEAVNSYRDHFVSEIEMEYIEQMYYSNYDFDIHCLECANNSDTYHALHLYHLQLLDERTNKITSLKLNDQGEVQTGTCPNCGSDHFQCPVCEEWVSLGEDGTSEVECENCSSRFEFDFDYPSETWEYIRLVDPPVICQKCNQPFFDDGSGINVCGKCDNEEAYGLL